MTRLLILTLFLFFSNTYNGISQNIEWLTLEEAQELSKEDSKPIFVFVEAEWCGICKRMLKSVFPNEGIAAKIATQYHPVKIDVESGHAVVFNDEKLTEREFARKVGVRATPTLLFFYSDGSEKGRFVGFLNEEDMNRLLTYVVSDSFYSVSFEEYSPQ